MKTKNYVVNTWLSLDCGLFFVWFFFIFGFCFGWLVCFVFLGDFTLPLIVAVHTLDFGLTICGFSSLTIVNRKPFCDQLVSGMLKIRQENAFKETKTVRHSWSCSETLRPSLVGNIALCFWLWTWPWLDVGINVISSFWKHFFRSKCCWLQVLPANVFARFRWSPWWVIVLMRPYWNRVAAFSAVASFYAARKDNSVKVLMLHSSSAGLTREVQYWEHAKSRSSWFVSYFWKASYFWTSENKAFLLFFNRDNTR